MLATTSTPENPPVALPVIFDNIPDALRDLPQWVAWRYQWSEKIQDWKKPPINPMTGRYADSTRPDTWASLEAAYKFYSDGGADGIGYVPAANGVVGVDLDDCRDLVTGRIEPWAEEELARLDTYAEVSPSGEGLRLFGFGDLPGDGSKVGPVEIYQKKQYVTVTGQRLQHAPARLAARQDALVDLYLRLEAQKAKALNQEPPPREPWAAPRGAGTILPGDDELIGLATRAKNGEKFRQLWSGNHSGYSSQSEADLALCAILAFWTVRDESRMDSLFRCSGLMREKWDVQSCGPNTYGAHTIRKAVEKCRVVFEGHALRPTIQSVQTEDNHGGGGSIQTIDSECSYSVCTLSIPSDTIPRNPDAVRRCLLKLARHLKSQPAVVDASAVDLTPTLEHWVAVSRPYVQRADFTVANVMPVFANAWRRARYLPGDGPLDWTFARAAAKPDAELAAHLAGRSERWARQSDLAVTGTFCRLLAADGGGKFFLGYETLTRLLGKRSWRTGGKRLQQLRDAGVIYRLRRGTSKTGASLYRWTFTANQKGRDA